MISNSSVVRILRQSVQGFSSRMSETVMLSPGAPGQLISQRGQLLYFTPYGNLQQQGVVGVEGNQVAYVVALLDRVSVGVLLKASEVQPQSKLQNTESNTLYLNHSNSYRIKDICPNSTGEDSVELKVKQYHKYRTCSKQQVFTGDSITDLFTPLCFGQFIVLQSKEYLEQMAKQFDHTVVYQQTSLLPNLGEVTRFIEESELGSQYLLPKAALVKAQSLASNKRVLLVYEDLTEHARACDLINQAIQQVLYPNGRARISLAPQLLGDLSQACGYRESESNLTVVVIKSKNMDDPVEVSLEREVIIHFIIILLLLQLSSLSSLPLPTKQGHLPSPMSLQYQWPILYMCASRLHGVLESYEEQRRLYEGRRKLNIHLEPWDYYLFLDGRVWMKMMQLLSKQNHDPVDLLVLSWWICRVVEEDNAGLLRDEPEVILKSLFQFMDSVYEFEGKNFKDYFYEMQGSMGNGKEFALFISESLNRLVELHLIHLRMNDLLLPYKKDHFHE